MQKTRDFTAKSDEIARAYAVDVHIKQRYPLSELVQAHADLEARITTGSTVIVP